jgi:hypothetical protein
MKIKLTKNELIQCIEFSKKVAKTQQDIEFGQRTTKPRSTKEIARDTLIGKLAEVAVKRHLEKYGINIELDFNIYPRGQWDDYDIVINNSWGGDIKSARSGSKWLLVEDNKINFRTENEKLPHMFIMCVTEWDRDRDIPTGVVEIKGFWFTYMFNESDKVLKLKKGQCIPNTRCKLQADNYAVHCDDLLKGDKWDIFKTLKNKKAPKVMINN